MFILFNLLIYNCFRCFILSIENKIIKYEIVFYFSFLYLVFLLLLINRILNYNWSLYSLFYLISRCFLLFILSQNDLFDWFWDKEYLLVSIENFQKEKTVFLFLWRIWILRFASFEFQRAFFFIFLFFVFLSESFRK